MIPRPTAKALVYLLDYFHDGAWWVVEIRAASWDDARERLRQIVATGRISGRLEMTVPARLGWFARAYCRLKNWGRRR